MISSPEQPAELHGRWTLYFYVPKGTTTIAGFSSGPGLLMDPDGRKFHDFDARPGYFRLAVPPGQDGKPWLFANTAGRRLLMTVPPCLARTPRELLLPAEVVEADRRR
jgi:hypothetical protein